MKKKKLVNFDDLYTERYEIKGGNYIYLCYSKKYDFPLATAVVTPYITQIPDSKKQEGRYSFCLLSTCHVVSWARRCGVMTFITSELLCTFKKVVANGYTKLGKKLLDGLGYKPDPTLGWILDHETFLKIQKKKRRKFYVPFELRSNRQKKKK